MTIRKIHLSESDRGQPITITDTATAGQLIHTSITGQDGMDLISIWMTNSNTATRTVTVEWGGSNAQHQTVVVLPGKVGEYWAIIGRPLSGGLEVRIFADAANDVKVGGFAIRESSGETGLSANQPLVI